MHIVKENIIYFQKNMVQPLILHKNLFGGGGGGGFKK